MPPNLGSERATVQDPLIGYAVEIGWAYLCPWRKNGSLRNQERAI